jgi:hypothetical protein
LERVPAIIVANACLTARTSEAIAAAKQGAAEEPRSEARPLAQPGRPVLPSGVRTTWALRGGERHGRDAFAEAFYGALFDDSNGRLVAARLLGDAVLAARQALWKQRNLYGPLGCLPALRRSFEATLGSPPRWVALPEPEADRCGALLQRFLPYLQYDSPESFRSDSRRFCPSTSSTTVRSRATRTP